MVTPPGATEYELQEEVAGSYLAKDSAGRQVLLVPTAPERTPLDRTTGSLSLSFRPSVLFRLGEARWDAPAAILACTNAALVPTFQVLARDIAARANSRERRVEPRVVSDLVSSWEELLRRRRALSRDEEVGLWGELWLLLQAPNVDAAVGTWRGPGGGTIDFVGGGVGIECKTTMRRLEHYFSQSQLERALGDVEVFVASLWVDRDEIGGRTVTEMVDAVARAVADAAAFEKALLRTGYSRGDAVQYTLRLRALEAPLWFAVASIPRVRAADPGVSGIRFTAVLDEAMALRPERGISLLGQLCGA